MHPKDISAIALIVVILGIGGYWGTRYFLQPEAHRHTIDDEAFVGAQLVRQAERLSPVGGKVTVLWLMPQNVEPYQTRFATLNAALSGSRTLTHVWAKDTGVYDDSDFVATIDHSLAAAPNPDLLVIVSSASVTQSSISSALRDHIGAGRKLLLMGDTFHGSQMVDLGRQGKAVFIARRSGWLSLKNLESLPQPKTPEEYFEQNYIVLDESFVDWPNP